jgi:hypothetical protein
MNRFPSLLLAAAGLALGCHTTVWAKTSNGNELALALTEAKNPQALKFVADDAIGRPHYFRYLQILEMEKGEKNGSPFVSIVAQEPSSYMKIRFVIVKPESREKLDADPVTKVGDAIAVTGKIAGIDMKQNLIVLNPVIVRHKDRIAPKPGKEMLYELDPSAIYYSYTGAGKDKVVHLTYKDRDLAADEKEYIAKYGKEAWADHLLQKLAEREKARKAAAPPAEEKEPEED